MAADARDGIADAVGPAAPEQSARFVLLACATTHAVTDGLLTAFYPLLPLMAADLGLSYVAVGSLRTALSGASSFFQLPAGYLAGWFPETTLLGVGMLWMALGFAALAVAAGFWQLLVITIGAGVGGSAQHPLATAIVSRAYETHGRGTAISTLNFSGDVGKFALPALAGFVALAYGWRGATVALGALGVLVTVGYVLALRGRGGQRRAREASAPKARGWGIEKPASFAFLSVIGIIDNGTRNGALTFLPFLLVDKGLDEAGVSLLLTLVFACGAAGKFGCGLLSDRFGTVGVVVITEAITALAILAVIPVDPLLLIPLLIAFGFVLNGTSSALYTAVADMVHVDSRARGYGLFYTLSLGGGTLAPIAYGALADVVGVPAALAAVGAVNLLTIPLAFAMARR